MNKVTTSRRNSLKCMGYLSLGCLISPTLMTTMTKNSMLSRKIPSTGESLPVVGLGTWIQFDVGNSNAEKQPLGEVLKSMLEYGGKLIDSSPMYGRSEAVIGELTQNLGLAEKFFYATKVWTSGRESGITQMKSSMRKMNRKQLDLIQVHNMVDWKVHLKTLNDWKEQGIVRYMGITHYTNSSHAQLEKIIETEYIDFVQFNYSINERHAENRLLETARDNNVAVIINRPYDGGSLFGLTKGKTIPPWAKDYDINSWGQFFLKYILSHSAVTCVIPGTSKAKHVVDNMQAGYGNLPDQKTREKMVQFIRDF